ncbi:unannotated protein [freshwater metagenome]|uniref:Nicotinamide nucleotide repair protein n=1 Tax=freshwater metagenome TaxID=449393 RepID=A0A6J7VC25_9ZZZZ|nr:NAD(P)H-hydrate dehydratase [Actinomycetota bacterium]
MKRAYRAADVRRVEAEYISRGVPLMERAAHAIAHQALQMLKSEHGAYGRRVLLLVGSGDNGGDALFAGAVLLARGVQVEALALTSSFHEAGGQDFLHRGGRWITELTRSYDLVIDGFLGLGARAGLSPEVQNALSSIKGIPTLAVDLPSGMSADGEELDQSSLASDLTLAIGSWKIAHLISESGLGVAELADIGVSYENERPTLISFEDSDVHDLLPTESVSDHKYRRGVLGVIAGSETFPGAGVLSIRAALALGIGMIRTESREFFSEVPEVVTAAGKIDALIAGPGLRSLSKIQEQAVEDHLATGGIVLLDAGAIPFLEQISTEHRQNILITPHHGEFATHFPDFSAKLQSSPLDCARSFVGAYGCNLLLKGPRTLIVSPDEIPVVNMRGSAALATAGSGDVLAGIIGNLMARTGSIRNSAIAGAYIHGKAGESLTAGASELIEILPFALR